MDCTSSEAIKGAMLGGLMYGAMLGFLFAQALRLIVRKSKI